MTGCTGHSGLGRGVVVMIALLMGSAGPADGQEAFPPVDPRQYPVVNSVAFSPDGGEIYFAVLYHDFLEAAGRSTSDAPVTAMFSVSRNRDGWATPRLLPFSGRFQDYEPTVSGDGRLMVFNSRRPYPDGRAPEQNDLWMSRMSDDGVWGDPIRIEAITTFEHDESYPSLSGTGELVYMAGRPVEGGAIQYDLFRSRLEGGRFTPPERHPVSSDRWGEGDPWIARDGSFLIFTRWDDTVGWAETVDLYISYSGPGGWSEPTPLTDLNSDEPSFGAAVSADGRWLYYKRGSRFHQVALQPVLDRHRPTTG